MTDLFGQQSKPETRKQLLARRTREERTKDGAYRNNPMIKIYGETPGKKCKTCVYLCYKQFNKKYYKCRMRPGTICKTSPKSDHRVNWPACGKYEQRNEETGE